MGFGWEGRGERRGGAERGRVGRSGEIKLLFNFSKNLGGARLSKLVYVYMNL